MQRGNLVKDPMLKRVKLGAEIGLIIGGLLSAWVVLLALVQFTIELPVDGHRVNLFAVLLLYLGGGIFGGALAGFLSPLARNAAGAVLVGIIVAFPLASAVGCIIGGFPPWDETTFITVCIMTAVFGPTLGIAYRRSFRRHLQKNGDSSPQ